MVAAQERMLKPKIENCKINKKSGIVSDVAVAVAWKRLDKEKKIMSTIKFLCSGTPLTPRVIS